MRPLTACCARYHGRGRGDSQYGMAETAPANAVVGRTFAGAGGNTTAELIDCRLACRLCGKRSGSL